MQNKYLASTACCLAALAGTAFAQTPGNVEIYGLLDLAYKKTQHGITEMKRGDNNRLGFRGNEDLGNGYSAFFVLEQRFETDTGTVEGGNRPLYQGQSRVGIKSPYGSVSFGRWLTAVQLNAGFDAFEGRTIGDMGVDIFTQYNSEGANAGNRIANAMFYSSPVVYGFKFDGNIATREQVAGSSFPYNVTPYSATLDYSNGASRSVIGHERNGNNDRLTTLGSSYDFGVVKVFGSLSRYAPNMGTNVTGKVISASIPVSQSSSVKVAYGMSSPKNQSSDTKAAVGYWYDISKRTKVYTDIVRLHSGSTKTNTMVYDIGLRHAF